MANALSGDNVIPRHVDSSGFCPIRKKSQAPATVQCGGEGPERDGIFVNTPFTMKRTEWEKFFFKVNSIYYAVLSLRFFPLKVNSK